MIKIYNPKSLKEIDKLRNEGNYNAPFSVLEAMNKVEINADTSKVEAMVESSTEASLSATLELYEKIEDNKKYFEAKQTEAVLAIYEEIGGLIND